jgi:hypothetical protein
MTFLGFSQDRNSAIRFFQYPRQGSNIPNDSCEKPHGDADAVQNAVQLGPKSPSVDPFLATMVDASDRLTPDQKTAVLALVRTLLDRKLSDGELDAPEAS